VPNADTTNFWATNGNRARLDDSTRDLWRPFSSRSSNKLMFGIPIHPISKVPMTPVMMTHISVLRTYTLNPFSYCCARADLDLLLGKSCACIPIMDMKPGSLSSGIAQVMKYKFRPRGIITLQTFMSLHHPSYFPCFLPSSRSGSLMTTYLCYTVRKKK